jgi:hypothetical protein
MVMPAPPHPPAWDPPPPGVAQDDFLHRNRRKFKNDVWLANYYINTAANLPLARQYVRALLSAGGRLSPGWLTVAQDGAYNLFRANWPNNALAYGPAIAQLNNDLMANRTVY